MGFTQITFSHMAYSPELGERIRTHCDALEARFARIERCRAAVEDFRTAERAHQFKVTLHVRLAGGRTLVASAHGPRIERVLQEVFAEADARLREGSMATRPA